MPFYFDPTYILIIIAYVITLWAQIKVKSAYAKYSKISNRAGLTGTDAAYAVLRSGGVTNVPVKAIAGELTDHYDPRDNTISLSSGVISTPSIAAVGVAAHEAALDPVDDRRQPEQGKHDQIVERGNAGFARPAAVGGDVIVFAGDAQG